ncbi:hypothetical protein ACSQ5K_26515 [Pseudomonas sp. PhalM4]
MSTFKRRAAKDQVKSIRDLGNDEPSVIHDTPIHVDEPAEPATAAPAEEAIALVVAEPPVAPLVEQTAAVAQTAGVPVAPVPQSGLSNVKSKVMNMRCQVNLKLIIAENAELHGLTAASFISLSALWLSQQPEEVANQAWKLLREVETGGYAEGTSPLFGIRHSPRFNEEVLWSLARNPIFAKNKSQAAKAAAAFVCAMSREEASKVMFTMRIFDSKSDLGLTENARVKA